METGKIYTLHDHLGELYLENLKMKVRYGEKGIERQRVYDIKPWEEFAPMYKRGSPRLINAQDQTVDIWIWSDQHFGHENIIGFSNRPYPNVDLMNECLIGNYKDVVSPGDIVLWVGDVSFMNHNRTNEILDQLPGYKILIIGNHDLRHQAYKKYNFDEIHLLYHLELYGMDLVLTHYPMENLPVPMINIHGHTHTHIMNGLQYVNVCVEQPHINYRPTALRGPISKIAKIRFDSMEKHDNE